MNFKRFLILLAVIGALAIVPMTGAQTAEVAIGEYDGTIEAYDGKWAVISGLRIKVKKAQLDDDIDRLYVGLSVEVDFLLKNGKFKATYIDDDDDNDDDDDRGELTGTITQKSDRSIVIGGIKFKTTRAEIDDDAPFYVGGRPDVEFYAKKFDKMIATEIDDD
jgi:hypothetical protein